MHTIATHQGIQRNGRLSFVSGSDETASEPKDLVERETGLEPATTCLGSSDSEDGKSAPELTNQTSKDSADDDNG